MAFRFCVKRNTPASKKRQDSRKPQSYHQQYFLPWLQYSGTLQTVHSFSYSSWISVSSGQPPLICKPVMVVQPWHLVKKVCYSVICQVAFYVLPFHRCGVTSLFSSTLYCFKFGFNVAVWLVSTADCCICPCYRSDCEFPNQPIIAGIEYQNIFGLFLVSLR